MQIVSSTSFGCPRPGEPEQIHSKSCNVFTATNILFLDEDDSFTGGTANYWLAQDRRVGEDQGFIVNLGCSKTVSGVSLKNTHNALCVFGKRGPKMFNFELGFSSKNREILHKAVLTPQAYEGYFFGKKIKKKMGEKIKKPVGGFCAS